MIEKNYKNKNVDVNQENVKIEEKRLLKPKNDFVFQCLFSKENEYITKEFVEALLDEKIEEITINETKELFRENPEDKLGVLDLCVEVNGREKVDIEIQLIKKEDFIERLLFYFSKLYVSGIKRGEKYIKGKKAVIIAIIDYELEVTKEIEEMATKWKLRCNEKTEKILTEKLEIDIIEIKKAKREYSKNRENKRAQWIMFLDNPEGEEVKEIMNKNEGVKEAVIKVKEMSEDEKMRKLEELREKAIRDEASCYSTGLHEGEKKRKGNRKTRIKTRNCKKANSYGNE